MCSNGLYRLKCIVIVSGTNQTSPATNLKWNRHRTALLSRLLCFAVKDIVYFLSLLYTIHYWKDRNVVANIYSIIAMRKMFALYFCLQLNSFEEKSHEIKANWKKLWKWCHHLLIHQSCKSRMQLYGQWGEGSLRGGMAGTNISK